MQFATEKEREEYAAKYLPLVRYVLNRMRLGRFFEDGYEPADLEGAGQLGLLDAMEKYEEGQDTQFNTYAVHRIRGAILDELRVLDPHSRGQQKRINAVNTAEDKLAQELGRTPLRHEVAENLDISREELDLFLQCSQPLFSMDALIAANNGDLSSPHEAIADPNTQRTQLYPLLNIAFSRLPEREKKVIALYYWAGLTNWQIGDMFGVSVSRTSQIYTDAVIHIRAEFKALLQAEESLAP
ncbi:sigma-70 family RNA polymerase sigma factor [Candidatus Falkowbacteria bacterium]|nr:sigma-70 family RNA polymerase sigma factor [Candidatus Falkowbacteria bacterium]